MTNWPTKKLGEIARIFSGSSAPQDEKYFKNGKYPFVRVFDLATPRSSVELVETRDYVNDLAITELNLVEAKKGAIVFPKSGASILNNNRAMLGTNAYVVSHLSAIEVDEDLAERNWVYYFLNKFDMGKLVSDPGYPSLNISAIEKIKIPLPPLTTQKQIVDRLDKIAKAQKLNDELIQKSEELYSSLLHNELNAKLKFKIQKLGEIAEVTSSKRIYQSEYVENGIPFYRTKEIVELSHNNPISLELFISENRFNEIKEKFGVPKKEDILISAVGTIGISWVVSDDRKFYFKDGNLLWIKNLKDIDPIYLKIVLDNFAKNIAKLGAGAAYNALTIIKLKRFQMPVPSIKIQKQIVAKLSAVQDYKKQLLAQRVKLKELFDGALHKSMNPQTPVVQRG